MLVAPGTQWEARDFGQGLLTKVPAAAWRKVDQGKGASGWTWWQTYEAGIDATGRVLFTVLGTGRRGSYILLLGTSQADFMTLY